MAIRANATDTRENPDRSRSDPSLASKVDEVRDGPGGDSHSKS